MLPARMCTFSCTSYTVLQLVFTTIGRAIHVTHTLIYRGEYLHDLNASACLLHCAMSAHHGLMLRMLTQQCTASVQPEAKHLKCHIPTTSAYSVCFGYTPLASIRCMLPQGWKCKPTRAHACRGGRFTLTVSQCIARPRPHQVAAADNTCG
jgi:hypothetical protein